MKGQALLLDKEFVSQTSQRMAHKLLSNYARMKACAYLQFQCDVLRERSSCKF